MQNRNVRLIFVVVDVFSSLFQMDFIAGCFHDGFTLYAKALSEALADGVSQNDGVGVIARMQNRRIWGTSGFDYTARTWNVMFYLSDCSLDANKCRERLYVERTVIEMWEPVPASINKRAENVFLIRSPSAETCHRNRVETWTFSDLLCAKSVPSQA